VDWAVALLGAVEWVGLMGKLVVEVVTEGV
jgi:hypothetical protein